MSTRITPFRTRSWSTSGDRRCWLSIDVRLLTADDDLEPDLDLSARAFGSFAPHEREQRLASARATVSDGHHLAVFDGPDMVASARYHDLRQWWRGRSLPAAGVASVKVA